MRCAIEEIGANYQSNMRAVVKILQRIDVPTFVVPPNERGRLLERAVVKCPNTPAFVKMMPSSMPAALSYGWTALVPTNPVVKIATCDALRYIVPTYIQRTMRQRMSVHTGSVPLIVNTLRDLHRWLTDVYGNSFNLAAAEQSILTPDMAHVALMREINAAISAEKIDVLPRPRFAGQRPNYIVRSKQHWWISKKAVNKYLSAAGIVPNWNALINCFTQQGVFCGEDVIHNNAGLLIERAWCDTFWSDYGTTGSKHVG
jgi:hypothetical protein